MSDSILSVKNLKVIFPNSRGASSAAGRAYRERGRRAPVMA